MEKIQPMCDGPVGMALYEMKDGKLGMTSVQGGPRGEGGLDDATGASGAAGGASYKQTSSTVDLSELLLRYLWVIAVHMARFCIKLTLSSPLPVVQPRPRMKMMRRRVCGASRALN